MSSQPFDKRTDEERANDYLREELASARFALKKHESFVNWLAPIADGTVKQQMVKRRLVHA